MPLEQRKKNLALLGHLYTSAPYLYTKDQDIDLVFIDGRWRKACYFLAIINGLEINRISSVIVDDCNDPTRQLMETMNKVLANAEFIDTIGRLAETKLANIHNTSDRSIIQYLASNYLDNLSDPL